MKHLPDNVQNLKDKELAEKLFPKKVLKKLKAELEKDQIPRPAKKS